MEVTVHLFIHNQGSNQDISWSTQTGQYPTHRLKLTFTAPPRAWLAVLDAEVTEKNSRLGMVRYSHVWKKSSRWSPWLIVQVSLIQFLLNTYQPKILKIFSYVIECVYVWSIRFKSWKKGICLKKICHINMILKSVCLYYLKYCTSSHPQNLAVVLRAAIGSNVPCSEVQRRSNKSCVTEGFGMIFVKEVGFLVLPAFFGAKVPWEKKIVSKSIIEEVWYCQNLQPLSLQKTSEHANACIARFQMLAAAPTKGSSADISFLTGSQSYECVWCLHTLSVKHTANFRVVVRCDQTVLETIFHAASFLQLWVHESLSTIKTRRDARA